MPPPNAHKTSTELQRSNGCRKMLQAHYDGMKDKPLPETLAKLMLALEAQEKAQLQRETVGNNSPEATRN